MKKSFAVSAALGAVLVLASCGSDDAETAAKNLRSEIAANSTVAAAGVGEEEADCVADGMVERIGVDQLRDYDILTRDLKVNQGIENVEMSNADADALADVFVGCLDVEALFAKQLAAGSTAAALTADQQECVAETVDEDVVKGILRSGFKGDKDGAYAALQEQMMECALREG